MHAKIAAGLSPLFILIAIMSPCVLAGALALLCVALFPQLVQCLGYGLSRSLLDGRFDLLHCLGRLSSRLFVVGLMVGSGLFLLGLISGASMGGSLYLFLLRSQSFASTLAYASCLALAYVLVLNLASRELGAGNNG